MSAQNSVEAELLSNPKTIWLETERLSKAYVTMMTNLRYRAFAALWNEGKTLSDIAKIFGIPVAHCNVVQTRARKSLGLRAVPFRNCSKEQSKQNRRSILEHPEMDARKLARLVGVTSTTVYNVRKETIK